MSTATPTISNEALKLPLHLQPLAAEITAYAQALPRLLSEGGAGCFALFKGEQLLSLWDTRADAVQAGHEHFGLDDSFVVKQVDPEDVQRLAAFS